MLTNLFSNKKQKSSYSWTQIAAGAITFASVISSVVAAYRKKSANSNGNHPGHKNDYSTNGYSDAEQTNSYDDWTKDQLYDKAQDLDIEGRSTMNKAELVEAIEKY